MWLPWEEWRDQEGDNQPVAKLTNKNGRWLASDFRLMGLMLSTANSQINALNPMKAMPTQTLVEDYGALDENVTLQQLLVNIGQPSCEEMFSNERQPRKDPLRALSNRQFSGSAAEFISAFPGLLKQATDALGLPEQDYARERVYITDTVRKCGQLISDMTPETVSSMHRGNYSSPDILSLGDPYQVCSSNSDVSSQLHALDKERDLGIGFSISPMWLNNKFDEIGLRVSVQFVPLKDNGMVSEFKDTTIVHGNVYSEAVAKGSTMMTALQALGNRKFEGTTDQFVSALPGLMEQAFKAMSLDPKNYQRETDYITTSVQRCAQITPEMIQHSHTRKSKYAQPNVEDLGDDYKMCRTRGLNVSNEVGKVYDRNRERAILSTVVSKESGQWNGDGFKVVLEFTNSPEEHFLPAVYFDKLGILFAEVVTHPMPAITTPKMTQAPVPPGQQDERMITLTPALSTAERVTTITAPGMGMIGYSLFTIDTREFAKGGILDLDINISGDSATDGSFDLFPAGVTIPTRGRPIGTLAGSYDIRKGSSTRIEYRFAHGQVFTFGLEGNWFSPKGATGMVSFRASVRNN